MVVQDSSKYSSKIYTRKGIIAPVPHAAVPHAPVPATANNPHPPSSNPTTAVALPSLTASARARLPACHPVYPSNHVCPRKSGSVAFVVGDSTGRSDALPRMRQ